VRQRAERKFHQIELIFSVGRFWGHQLYFDVFPLLHDSPSFKINTTTLPVLLLVIGF
jgi:hypothetical protein